MSRSEPVVAKVRGALGRRGRLLVVGLAALATDCKCIEHPLYDAGVNRFDTWYLGGGNTQYRPFRSVEYDPDTRFEVAVRLRDTTADEPVVIVAQLSGELPEDVEGRVVILTADHDDPDAPASEHVLGEFEHVDDGLVTASLDRAQVLALAADTTVALRFVDEVGATATLRLFPSDILEQADPARHGDAP